MFRNKTEDKRKENEVAEAVLALLMEKDYSIPTCIVGLLMVVAGLLSGGSSASLEAAIAVLRNYAAAIGICEEPETKVNTNKEKGGFIN